MLETVLLLGLGLALTVKGGDSFVDGASWMARATGIPPFLVAATVVSLATTMPEMLVSALAAARGSPELSLGNAVGSVSCNTGLILGLSVLLLPGRAEGAPLRDKGVLLALAVLALMAFAIDGRLSWSEAVFLLILLGVLAAWCFLYLLLGVFLWNSLDQARRSPLAPGEEGAGGRRAAAVYLGRFLFGAAGLAAGAQLLVENGSVLALRLGVPESVIGLTLLALGTSLPELVTTLTALAKGQPSLSVGNILGANFLDLTAVPAVSAFAAGGSLPMGPELYRDLGAALLMLLAAVPPALSRGRFSRWQGALLLGLYGGYLFLLFR